MRRREQALEARTATLADRSRRAEQSTAALTTKVAAVDQLQRDVQQLQKRVDALERQPPAPSPTATP
jgi:Tfp pilus assembly protein PilN